jgi:4'-phosphopantetheinyl transferase
MKFPPSALPTDNEIHVWHIDLDAGRPSDFTSVLSRDEIARAERFAFAHHRDRFICGRYAMRCILSHLLGIVGSKVAIVYGPNGKPSLKPDSGGNTCVGFNMTHSEHLALLAIGGAHDIGIDIEILRAPQDIRALAKSVFSEQENAQFQALAPGSLVPAFFTCWTQKEAVLKALGTGLTLDANLIHVGLDSADKKIMPPANYGTQTIAVTMIEGAYNPDSIASLAVIGELSRVLHFDYADHPDKRPRYLSSDSGRVERSIFDCTFEAKMAEKAYQ